MPLSPSLARVATAHPPLPAEETKRLVARAQQGDTAARDRVVATHLRFIFSQAMRYARRSPRLTAEDLVSEGTLGLLRAVEKFDLTASVGFLTYAGHWICSFMSRAVVEAHSHFGGSGHVRELVASGRLLRLLVAARAAGVTEDALPQAIAPKARASAATVRASMRLLRETRSLDEPVAGLADTNLHDQIPAPGRNIDEEFGALQLRAQLHDRLRTLRDSMRPREKVIFDRRLFVAKGDAETLAEIGDRLGLTRERVRQLEAVLICRLAAALADFRHVEGEDA